MFRRRPPTTTNDEPTSFEEPQAPPVRPFLRPSLGPETSVNGRLSFEAPTRIDGKLRGEVRARELLVIGETGLVDGIVRAAQLVVHGQVHGEIRNAESVEITATAIVTGLIEAQSLIVHDGATVDGDIKVEPPRAATVHVLRPPTSN